MLRRDRAGRAIRAPHVATLSRVHGDRRAHARHRHRREHRDLQRRRRGAAPAVALSGRRSARLPLRAESATDRCRASASRTPTFSTGERTTRSFAGMAAYHRHVAHAAHRPASRLRLSRLSVTSDFFDVLGARPLLGRLYHGDEPAAETSNEIVLALRILAAAVRRRHEHRRPHGQGRRERECANGHRRACRRTSTSTARRSTSSRCSIRQRFPTSRATASTW